jgi:hypothetical protein
MLDQTTQTKTLPRKIAVLQIAGQCKKMKAHKEIPQLTLTEDDAELIAEKVQDRMEESWYDVEKQREEIVNKLIEFKYALEHLHLTTTQQKDQAQQ